MREIAALLQLTPPQVYETVTFYTMLNLKRVGKFHIQVCKSLMCALVGSDTLIGWIKTKLGIGPRETTTDGVFTLSTVECLAACGTAPMMQINDDYYERLTEEKVDRILADLRTTGTCSLKTGPFMWPEPATKAQTMSTHEPILLKNMLRLDYSGSLADYEQVGGYQAIRKVFGKMVPKDVTQSVMKSGLRG